MLVPRLAALALLGGIGFALARLAQLLYVVAAEGYTSWIAALAFLAPTAAVAVASTVLVLRRHPLGARLALPLAVLVLLSSVVALAGAPPAGTFFDDYESAALARGVEVPEFYRDRGYTPARYVSHETSDVRTEGSLGALGAVGIYALAVRVRVRRRGPSSPAR